MKYILLFTLLLISTATISEAGRYYPPSDYVGTYENNFEHHLGVEEPVPGEGEAFRVYPNPVRFGLFKISYHLAEVSPLTVNLYNVLGKVVKKAQFEVSEGKGTVEVDTQDISAGVYFVEIKAVGLMKTERIIIL